MAKGFLKCARHALNVEEYIANWTTTVQNAASHWKKNPISALSKERPYARIGCLKTMTFTVRTAAPWGADSRLYHPESANALCVEEEAGDGEVSSSVKLDAGTPESILKRLFSDIPHYIWHSRHIRRKSCTRGRGAFSLCQISRIFVFKDASAIGRMVRARQRSSMDCGKMAVANPCSAHCMASRASSQTHRTFGSRFWA